MKMAESGETTKNVSLCSQMFAYDAKMARIKEDTNDGDTSDVKPEREEEEVVEDFLL